MTCKVTKLPFTFETMFGATGSSPFRDWQMGARALCKALLQAKKSHWRVLSERIWQRRLPLLMKLKHSGIGRPLKPSSWTCTLWHILCVNTFESGDLCATCFGCTVDVGRAYAWCRYDFLLETLGTI